MDLDIIPSEARVIIPAFVHYRNSTNWPKPKPPQLSLGEAPNWNAETWAQFLDWMSTNWKLEMFVQQTFVALKPHILKTYKDYRPFCEYFNNYREYVRERLHLVVCAENLVDFILFHEWFANYYFYEGDVSIRDQVIFLIKKFSPTPTQWMKGFEHTSLGERSDQPTAQLIATHWEATEASFQEWARAVYLLNQANVGSVDHNPAVDPEIVLLRQIAIDKMRAIVRADRTFKNRIRVC